MKLAPSGVGGGTKKNSFIFLQGIDFWENIPYIYTNAMERRSSCAGFSLHLFLVVSGILA